MTEENKQKLINRNLIVEMRTGSHLYGLQTETSDEDFTGIFFDPMDMLLNPFQSLYELDLSIKDKLQNGKNSKDAIDKKFYTLKKFIKLAADCNPNILEMLFVDDNNVIRKDSSWDLLRENRKII